MTTRVLLIRHGETEWNRLKRYCGFIDVALNATGKQQARKLGKRLDKEPVHKVYASDRLRALETARLVFKGRRIKRLSGLREMHFGIFEGLTHKEILKKYPELYGKWLKDPYSIGIPKGESLTGFRKRIIRAVKEIVRAHQGETVALVCHGGAISALLAHLKRSKEFWGLVPKSASLSIVEFRSGKPVLVMANDTEHLHG